MRPFSTTTLIAVSSSPPKSTRAPAAPLTHIGVKHRVRHDRPEVRQPRRHGVAADDGAQVRLRLAAVVGPASRRRSAASQAVEVAWLSASKNAVSVRGRRPRRGSAGCRRRRAGGRGAGAVGRPSCGRPPRRSPPKSRSSTSRSTNTARSSGDKRLEQHQERDRHAPSTRARRPRRAPVTIGSGSHGPTYSSPAAAPAPRRGRAEGDDRSQHRARRAHVGLVVGSAGTPPGARPRRRRRCRASRRRR